MRDSLKSAAKKQRKRKPINAATSMSVVLLVEGRSERYKVLKRVKMARIDIFSTQSTIQPFL